MRTFGVLEARTRFSALVSEVEQTGEEVTVTRNGRPVVKVVPAKATRHGQMSGEELQRLFADLRARNSSCNPNAMAEPERVLRELRDGTDARD